jgi:AcrR family transcriptional regulator
MATPVKTAAATPTTPPAPTTAANRPTGREEILDAVLDAAQRLFAAAGPADVSMRTIAAEAGVTYGLVHRHFGTKDALVDQLLQRYATRWTTQLERTDGYAEQLEYLLGPGPDTGAYLRLLAWTFLSDRNQSSAAAHRRHALLDRLPALHANANASDMSDDDVMAASMKTAAALSLVFGWRLFNPFIKAALHLDEVDPATMQDAIRAELRTITEG